MLLTYWHSKSSFSLVVRASCSMSFLAIFSSSLRSETVYCSSLDSFWHSFSLNSFLLASSSLFLRRFLSSFYSCSCLWFRFSFWVLMRIKSSLRAVCLACSADLSWLAALSSTYSVLASFYMWSTWLHTSVSWVRDLLSLTANSLRTLSVMSSNIFCYNKFISRIIKSTKW